MKILSDPNQKFPTRQELSILIGYKQPHGIYLAFEPHELAELELQGLDERRKRYAPMLAEVDKALIERADTTGDPAAIKLIYQRLEGWSEKSVRENTGPGGAPLYPSKIEIVFVRPGETLIDGQGQPQVAKTATVQLKLPPAKEKKGTP